LVVAIDESRKNAADRSGRRTVRRIFALAVCIVELPSRAKVLSPVCGDILKIALDPQNVQDYRPRLSGFDVRDTNLPSIFC
jgi:hypothetical protein